MVPAVKRTPLSQDSFRDEPTLGRLQDVMTTSTRLQYRTDLGSKLLALEDGGYGDFDYEDVDLNLFLTMAVARMYPAAYQKVKQASLPLVTYGTQNMTFITPAIPERVFLIEDTVERTPVLGWRTSGTDIINIDPYQGGGSSGAQLVSVNVYYHDAFALPTNDQQQAGIPNVFEPLILLGALIEACEARQDTGVRGDPAPVGTFMEMPLLDRLNTRYAKLWEQLAMGMPAVML